MPPVISDLVLQTLWLIGPTSMLVTAVFTVAVIAFLDFFFIDDKTFADLLAQVRERDRTLSSD